MVMTCVKEWLGRANLSRTQKVLLRIFVLLTFVSIILLVLAVTLQKSHDENRQQSGKSKEQNPSTTSTPVPTSRPSQQLHSPFEVPSTTLRSASPSTQPSDTTEHPSVLVTPTTSPTAQPSESLSMSSSSPTESSALPSIPPSQLSTVSPSLSPTKRPTLPPTTTRSASPSTQSTWYETSSSPPSSYASQTIFYVVADAPYNHQEAVGLSGQVASLPSDAEFLVHLGDIKHGERSCVVSRLQQVSDILKQSPVPVFVLVGDNEFNDCADPASALIDWKNTFGSFDQHWNHSLNVGRPTGRRDSFYFVLKKTLFIGLNIPGGEVHDTLEWKDRLEFSANWTIGLVTGHTQSEVNGVVIFAHANPGDTHSRFFNPIRSYIRDDLKNSIPILYMCGDTHLWLREPNFFNQRSFLRIRLTGGVSEPPLRMMVDPTTFGDNIEETFQYDRFWN